LGVLLMSEAPVDAGGEPQLDVPPPGGDEWLTRRPDIRRLAAQYHAAARVVDDTWKDWLPEGTLLFQPEYVTPAGLFQPSKSWRAIAQLSVNLFDGGRGATRRIRIAERENARIALEGAQNRARSDLRAAQEAVASTDRAAQSARRAAESALEVVKITGVAFREGATTNIEVVQAQQTARTAEIAAAQADDSARQARLDLIVALGLFP
jgi:outer membrane protein TolC